MPSNRDLIVEKLNSFSHLPTLNETARKVQQLLSGGNSDAVSAAAIGKIIEKDLGLTAKVLKLANSVYYAGKYGQISDVGQAVARLGVTEINQLCTTVSGFQLFSNTAGSIDLKDFWKHSLGVAIVMRYIAGKTSGMRRFVGHSYASGLFHDIGILLLDRYFSEIFTLVLQSGNRENLPLFSAERSTLGIDHGEIGSLLCQKWNLPEEICMSIAWHHTPDECPEDCRLLSQLINIANFTCSVLGIAEPGDHSIAMGSIGAWHDLGLDNCNLGEMAEHVEEGIARSGVFVALSL